SALIPDCMAGASTHVPPDALIDDLLYRCMNTCKPARLENAKHLMRTISVHAKVHDVLCSTHVRRKNAGQRLIVFYAFPERVRASHEKPCRTEWISFRYAMAKAVDCVCHVVERRPE